MHLNRSVYLHTIQKIKIKTACLDKHGGKDIYPLLPPSFFQFSKAKLRSHRNIIIPPPMVVAVAVKAEIFPTIM